MSENLHDIDKLFRDGIEAHEDMPPAKLWEAIDAGLDKNNVVHIKRKYDNLKRIAAILLLLLLSVVGYEIFKGKTAGEKDIAGNKGSNTQAPSNTNPAAKSNAANEQAQKNNVIQNSAADNTASNSNAQSGSTDNAGYDPASGNKPPVKNDAANDNARAVKPGAAVNTKTPAVANNNVPAVSGKDNIVKHRSGKNNGSTPVINDAGDELYRNTLVKRPAGNKTSVKIKSPLPQQDAEDAAGDNLAADENATTAANKLSPLQNTRVNTLAARINNMMAAKETKTAKRQVPDVAIRKMRLPKSFHFSVMPFYSQQFAANNIKEESHGQWNTNSPGGPPPPRPGRGDHKEQYKEDEQRQTSYSVGLLATVPLGKKWSVQSGITYLNKNISIEPKKIYARQDKDGNVKYVFDCSSGYSYISTKTGTTPTVGDSINTVTSKNTLGYIGVPLLVNYTFSLGKFSIIPNAGAVLNFLTMQKIQTALVQGTAKEQQSINKIEGLQSSYLNATAGIAFEYNVNKRIALDIMPSGNFALTSINNSNAPVKSYPNAFGILGGVKIKF